MALLWRFVFVFQVLAGLNAVIVFRTYERPIAGLIASLAFIAVGVATFLAFVFFSKRFRPLGVTVSGIYLFLFALPLTVTRLTTPLEVGVETVMRVPLPLFHRGSEISFLLIVIMTLLQIWLTREKSK